jgi:hypothetical protein
MVFRTNAIQAGWHFDQDDAIIDNSSIDSTYSTNHKENPMENDSASRLRKILDEKVDTRKDNKHTKEEGWTITTPGRTKPKNRNTVASTESIIMKIEGNFETFEAGTTNTILVKSPDRNHKCNIPETTKILPKEQIEFDLCITQQTKNTGKGTKQSNNGQEKGGQVTNTSVKMQEVVTKIIIIITQEMKEKKETTMTRNKTRTIKSTKRIAEEQMEEQTKEEDEEDEEDEEEEEDKSMKENKYQE